ncbi:MAG TPA: hypothetical protein VGG62_16120 [Terracidiphilus sp.]|jgi:hypothetical protein
MNASPRNGLFPETSDRDLSQSGEDTLRLIASLPAPEGLPDRVHEGLRHAPQTARVLNWRRPIRPSGGWMQSTMARSAAAAAIVCVVAGGGWRIYSRVQPTPAVRVLEMPSRVAPGGGGFSQAGAKRVPDTLNGPVLTHPLADNPVADNPEPDVVVKAPDTTRPVHGKRTPAKKPAARPVVTPMP